MFEQKRRRGFRENKYKKFPTTPSRAGLRNSLNEIFVRKSVPQSDSTKSIYKGVDTYNTPEDDLNYTITNQELSNFRKIFEPLSEIITFSDGILEEVDQDTYKHIQDKIYLHGTKSTLEKIKREGFRFDKPITIPNSSRPFHEQIAGNMVFFTTYLNYAQIYALDNDQSNIIGCHIPRSLKIFRIDYSRMREEVLEVVYEKTKLAVNQLYPEGINSSKLLAFANEAFNMVLLRQGVGAIAGGPATKDENFISFIGLSNIPYDQIKTYQEWKKEGAIKADVYLSDGWISQED